MKKTTFACILAVTFLFAGSLSYADIPNNLTWDFGQKTENHQILVMDVVANIDIFGIFQSSTRIYIETDDTAVYTVNNGGICTNNSFRNCYDVKTGVYHDVEMNETASYIDLTDAQGPGLNPPNDITPVDLKSGGIRNLEQLWEIYNRPGYSDNLGTWRRTYNMDFQMVYQCTPSQGEWNLDVLEPNGQFHCTQQEANNYTWKDFGTRTMVGNLELIMCDRDKILGLGFPIYEGKPTFTQSGTCIQANGELTLPLSIFTNAIDVSEQKAFTLTLDYDYTNTEPVHGVCVNDEQPHISGEAVNENDPSDIIGFNQWFSLGLEYLSFQRISGIKVHTHYQDPYMTIDGDITIPTIDLATTIGVDAKGITTDPSPLIKGDPGDFNNEFFIMGPDNGNYPVTFGFQILNVPPQFQGPYTKTLSLGCGIHNQTSYHINSVPGLTPNPLTVIHGLLFKGLLDTGGPVNLPVEW